MATKSKAATNDESELSLEERIQRLEKAAGEHGWDLNGGTDPVDPPQ